MEAAFGTDRPEDRDRRLTAFAEDPVGLSTRTALDLGGISPVAADGADQLSFGAHVLLGMAAAPGRGGQYRRDP